MSRIGSGGLAEARRLHALGVEHNNAGHPLRAIRLFRRALSLPELARPPASRPGWWRPGSGSAWR